MAVTKIHTAEIDESLYSLPIEQGGTGARSPEKAAENLGLVSTDQIDQPNGVALLGEDTTVQRKHYPVSLTDNTLPVFFGDHQFYNDKTLLIQIVNYDSSVVYTIDPVGMDKTNYSRNGDLITLSAKNNGYGAQVLRVNGREFPYEVIQQKPYAPTLTNLTGNLLSDRIHLTNKVPFESQMFAGSAFGDISGQLVHSTTDWEISQTIDFATLVKNSSLGSDKANWTVTAFSPDTVFFLRFRHVATSGAKSDWSPIYEFQTAVLKMINAPTINVSGAGDLTVDTTPWCSASDFSVTELVAQHVSSDWQIATDVGFTNIVSSVTDSATNKTTWTASGLTPGASYHARVRYRSDVAGSNGSFYSDWSATRDFTVTLDDRAIETPEVSIVGGSTSVSKTAPVFNGTAFLPLNFTDTHVSSDWQIATDSTFTNVVHSSTGSTANKVTWSPTTTLSDSTIYYARCRYNGNVKISAWSPTVPFVTSTMFEITAVGAGGGGGFGVDQTTSSGQNSGNVYYHGGGGGGGGGVSKTVYSPQFGQVYDVVVGGGGGQGGGNGGFSSVSNLGAPISKAMGGLGGHNAKKTDPNRDGGAGGNGSTATGGAGGAAGGSRYIELWEGTGSTDYYYSSPGAGVSPGGMGNTGGGGGGSPYVHVPGLTFSGGNCDANPSQGGAGHYDGYTASGGAGGPIGLVVPTSGVGGDGAVVVEYSSSMPLLETTGATYSVVNGKHRYIWSAHGTYTFKLSAFVANFSLSSVNNYNLKTDLIARGWDQISPVDVTVTIPNGVVIGATAYTNYAFDTGAGYPSGSKLKLINSGYIVGKGGDGDAGAQTPNGSNVWYGGQTPGGPAFISRYPISVTNNGTIGGGGGGGGHGGPELATGEGAGYIVNYGGAGGGGAGSVSGAGGRASMNQGQWWGGWGSDGTLLTGGGGAASGGSAGGDLGQPGYSGIGPSYGYFAPGGGASAGNAVEGNNNITWVSTGTRLGAIVN